MATTQVTVGKHHLVLQDPGISWVLDVEEGRAFNPVTGKLSLKLYAQEILRDVVVEPRGLEITDFTTVRELGDLVRAFKNFRESLATGGTRPPARTKQADKSTA